MKKKIVKEKVTDFYKLEHLEEIDSDKYEDGTYVTKISSEKNTQGYGGIRIQSASKKPYFKSYKPGVWIPNRINLSKWFVWFSSTIKRFTYKIWGKQIEDLSEEVTTYKEKVELLNNELLDAKLKLKDAEVRLNKQQLELNLAKEVIDKIEVYESKLTEFETEVKRISTFTERDEQSIKLKLKESRWILGIDCEVKASEKEVDPQLAIDLHIKTEVGEDKVFEFKSPNIKLFFKKKEDARLYISEELSQGINQLILYLRRTDLYSGLSEEGTYKIQAPSGVVVMGYDLSDEEKRLLKNWNFQLRPHIKIVTFNEIIETGKRQLQNIKYARNNKLNQERNIN